MPRTARQTLVVVAAIFALAGPAAAQDMTTGDVQRLEQRVDEINAEIARVRGGNRSAARAWQTELLELDEEVTYLKVKLRKERYVSRADYLDVRNRLDNLSARVGGRDTGWTPYGDDARPQAIGTEPGTVPVGTELDVRLRTGLSSDTAQVEDRFEATTEVDLRQDGRVLIPAGAVVRGVVTQVREAGRIERKGSLALSFDQITFNGRTYPLRASVAQVLEAGGYKEDAEKIGTGAAVGGIIGGILGGVKGAIAGVLIGGGGVVAATEGEDVNLAPGSIVRMRLDSPLKITNNNTRRQRR